MRTKRHKPPSRLRYEEAHPVVSGRIKKDLYNELKTYLNHTNQSFGDFVRIALDEQEMNYEESFDDGYSNGENDWKIWYFCSICNKKIYIQPNSESHKSLIKYMQEHGWGHTECHKNKISE